MAPIRGYALSPEFADRVVDVVEEVENTPRSPNAPRIRKFHETPNHQFCYLNSPLPNGCGSGSGAGAGSCPPAYMPAQASNVYYDATVTSFDTANETWSDLGRCWLMEANKQGLDLGPRYLARQSGNLCIDGEVRPLFITDRGALDGGCVGQGSGSGECAGTVTRSRQVVFEATVCDENGDPCTKRYTITFPQAVEVCEEDLGCADNGGGSGSGAGSVPCTLDFTAADTTPPVDVPVTFTPSLTGDCCAVESYHWERSIIADTWEDFASATSANPSESFSSGTWSIRLTVVTSCGTLTLTKTDYIVCGGDGEGA